jgi:hypothetical protein
MPHRPRFHRTLLNRAEHSRGVDDPVLRDLYQAKRALIRSDQHVAWRGDEWAVSDVLRSVCGRPADRAVAEVANVG